MSDFDKLILTVLKEQGPLSAMQIGQEMKARGCDADTDCNAVSLRLIELAKEKLVSAVGDAPDAYTGRVVKMWRCTEFYELTFMEQLKKDELTGVTES